MAGSLKFMAAFQLSRKTAETNLWQRIFAVQQINYRKS